MEIVEKENLNISKETSKVSSENMKNIARKVEAIITLGIVAAIPVNAPIDVIVLGEGGNLPKIEQSWFETNFNKIRGAYDIEVDDGKSGGAGATGNFGEKKVEFGGGKSGGGGASGNF